VAKVWKYAAYHPINFNQSVLSHPLFCRKVIQGHTLLLLSAWKVGI